MLIGRLQILCCAMAGALLCAGAAAQGEQRTTRTTRVVTAADGTRTTTVTEVRTTTQGGRTTTTRTTTTRTAAPDPAQAAPEAAQAAPEPAQAPAAAETDGTGRPVLRGPALGREAVALHNRERALTGARPLTWSESLAGLAQDWANQLCGGGKGARGLRHRQVRMGGPGENLWQGAATGTRIFLLADAVRDWAAEKRFYNPRTGRCQGGVCGHYTQMIWGDTTQVGCGVTTCPAGGLTATVWVCNYQPAGNVLGARP